MSTGPGLVNLFSCLISTNARLMLKNHRSRKMFKFILSFVLCLFSFLFHKLVLAWYGGGVTNINIVECYPVNYHFATLETLEKRQKIVETDYVLDIS